MKRLGVVGLVIALAVLAGGGWFAYLAVKPKLARNITFVFLLRLESATLPANDKVLEGWLREQPSVDRASITRDGKWIVIEYQTTGDSSFPSIQDKCKSLGYGPTGSMTFKGGVGSLP